MIDLDRVKEIVDQESAYLGVEEDSRVAGPVMGAEWTTPNGRIKLIASKASYGGRKPVLNTTVYVHPSHREFASSMIAREQFDNEGQFELFLKQILPRAEEALLPREQHS